MAVRYAWHEGPLVHRDPCHLLAHDGSPARGSDSTCDSVARFSATVTMVIDRCSASGVHHSALFSVVWIPALGDSERHEHRVPIQTTAGHENKVRS